VGLDRRVAADQGHGDLGPGDRRRPRHREIPGLLALVGLQARAEDRVRGYSIGMKQRLGIAAALVGDPRC